MAVFRRAADRIGLLDAQAMEVVIVYDLMDGMRNAIERLAKGPPPIPPVRVAAVANYLMELCKRAQIVLPKVKTSIPAVDDKDAALINQISNEAAIWEVAKKEWPDLADRYVQR